MIYKRDSKSDPQALSKKQSTNVTKNVINKRYWKSYLKTLHKIWSTNIIDLFNPWKHDSTLKIQKESTLNLQNDSTLKVHKDSIQKCFSNSFHGTDLFNPWQYDYTLNI